MVTINMRNYVQGKQTQNKIGRIPEYRGKRKDGSGWISGSHSYRTFGDGMAQHFVRRFDDAISHEIKPETLQQFTGTLDCHGIKVYEGDIIRIVEDRTNHAVVWNDEEKSFDVDPICDKQRIFDTPVVFFGIASAEGFEYEVIGNILDLDEINDHRRMKEVKK